MINNASRLHDELKKFAGQYSDWADARHLSVMCWMIVGLIAEGSVNLTKWIYHVHSKAQIAQSIQRQLSRWMKNPRINPAKLYSPIVKVLLADWDDPIMYLSLDTTMLWAEYCIIRVSVVHLGRGVTVGWRVLRHKSSSVHIDTYADLLKRISKRLPAAPKKVLLADRGFANPKLLVISQQLGWHCRIRIKGNVWLKNPRQDWQRASGIPLAMGEAKFIQNVRLHKRNSIEGVHLAIGWEESSRERWYVLSTETVSLQTFYEYGLRFTIEEEFLDDKSNGFDLESSGIRSVPALSRLCLVLAVSTLFLTAQGVEVVVSGNRRKIDPHWFRGMSYLKIGWGWIKQALNKGWEIISNIVLVTNKDPDPVMASRLQHEKRSYRIHFVVYDLDWAC
jgi:hypothetical protein